jgi:hypothetical protein
VSGTSFFYSLAIHATNPASAGPLYAYNDATGDGCAVDSSGDLSCTGTKNAVVPVDGGARRVALSAIESPQNWFEDFGSAQLVHGVAVVTLDPTFLQTINAEMDYKVFPVPDGDCKGLYVTNKTATSFEVHELGGGASSVSFDYRITALRRKYENVRFADHTHDRDEATPKTAAIEGVKRQTHDPTRKLAHLPAKTALLTPSAVTASK